MIYTVAGKYQITAASLPEYQTAGFTQPSGAEYPNLAVVTITKIQENVPGVAEWGQLANGKWIPMLQNGRMKVRFISTISVPPPPPPPPPPVPVDPTPSSAPVHRILVNETGKISLDGLPYE